MFGSINIQLEVQNADLKGDFTVGQKCVPFWITHPMGALSKRDKVQALDDLITSKAKFEIFLKTQKFNFEKNIPGFSINCIFFSNFSLL